MLTRRQFAGGMAGFAIPAVQVRAADMPLPRLRRGINFHHMLNWPDAKSANGQITYVWPAFQNARFGTSDAELRALVAAGFDFVRLTVDPSIFIVAQGHDAVQIQSYAKDVVRRLLDHNLNIIFDLHPVAVNPLYAPEVLVRDIQASPFRDYLAMVGSIAALLGDLPPHRVALELMNEPRLYGTGQADAARWQTMLVRLHARARAAAPMLPLVLTGGQVSDAKALPLLNLQPFRGSNVLYTFHFYEPYAFTHQSVPGIEPQCISNLIWPEDDADAEAALARSNACLAALPGNEAQRSKASQDTLHLIKGYERHRFSAREIEQTFDGVGRWAADNGVSPSRILLGEFGCAWGTTEKADDAPRLAWLRAVVANAERKTFPWAYWAYRGQRGMTLVEGNSTTFDPEVIAVLQS